jgi:valyl-tRNA synthetase
MTKKELPKKYNPKESEPKWTKWWDTEKIYAFDPTSENPIYSIDTPPPTVSGRMHIGHAFSYSQMDFIARYKRMQGFNMFYPFGTDDNGLATERLIEKTKNVRHTNMSREEFRKFCLDTLDNELRPKYISDWKKIGVSADYNIFYTTINNNSQKISQKSFIDLYNQGREYQKEAPTMWCPECHMAIAQVELIDKELDSTFNDIIFKLDNGKDLVIATTRPELLPSCVAIFAHPRDKRYKELIGKTAKVPLFNIRVDIKKDDRVDMKKGTGIVMCCTFGDQTDIEWYHAHNLPLVMSITPDGKMTEKAGKYQGMSILDARKAILADLKAAKLLVKQTPIKHEVNVHERCGTPMEIINSKQWFIKYLDLKDDLRKAGESLNWYPNHMVNRYQNWVEGLQWDWCISRQRFYGVPIPCWYCKNCGKVTLPAIEDLPIDPLIDKPKKDCTCGSSEFEPEKDVLDTWATSSLTPKLAAEMFPEQFDKIYPMDLRPQAHDIITFWLFNTVVKAQMHDKVNPWKDVMISGWALDPHGKKMSKSFGNVVDPHAMIENYSADALRFWAAGSSLGDDLPFQEKDLATGQKFAIKMFNACKFVIMQLEGYKPKQASALSNQQSGKKPTAKSQQPKLRAVDKWILSRMNTVIKFSTESFEKYEYSKAKLECEKLFWHEFCDYYLEIVKDRIYSPEKYAKGEKEAAQYTLYTVASNVLKLFAPIMPYVTEEIYQMYFKEFEKAKSIHVCKWPKADKSDVKIETAGEILKKLLASVRQFKQEKAISLGKEVKTLYIDARKEELKKAITMFKLDLQGASRAEKLVIGKGEGEKVNCELSVEMTMEL